MYFQQRFLALVKWTKPKGFIEMCHKDKGAKNYYCHIVFINTSTIVAELNKGLFKKLLAELFVS